MPARLKGKWFYEFTEESGQIYRCRGRDINTVKDAKYWRRDSRRSYYWKIDTQIMSSSWSVVLDIPPEKVVAIAEGLETFSKEWNYFNKVSDSVDILKQRAQEMLVAYDMWSERKTL